MKKERKRIIAALLCAAGLLMSGGAGVSAHDIGGTIQISVCGAGSSEKNIVIHRDYESGPDYAVITWEEDPEADGYVIYMEHEGKFKKLGKTSSASYTVTGLAKGMKYSLRVRSFVKSGSKIKYIGGSETKTVVTAPVEMPVIRSIVCTNDESKVKLSWNSVGCTGYRIFCYNWSDKKWVRAANIGNCEADEFVFNTKDKAMGGKAALNRISSGEFGYRFKIEAYSKDDEGVYSYKKTFVQPQEDTYYSIKSLTKNNKDGLKNLSRASRTSKGTQNSFIYYQTTTSDGERNTKEVKITMTEGDIAALRNFEKKYFKKSWTDEQKILFTANWINKNVTYDYSYDLSNKVQGFSDRIFNYKTGQCDAYNGALVEMMLYLGYEGPYLHWWDANTGSTQHARAFIVIKGNTYSFEDGNGRKSGPDWFWFCDKTGDELM